MTEPLVTVVLPTRNRAELLLRAIASVRAQTWPSWELIVINDASTDNTREVLASIDDPRIQVLHRERNQGASAARNAGISLGQGKYVAFLDDDDYWLPEKLAKQVAVLERSDKPWCIASFRRLGRAGERYIGGDELIRQLDFAFGIGESSHDWSLIATPGWLVHRETLVRVGAFDERIRSWDDWELGIRLFQAGGHVILDEALWVQDVQRGGGLIRAWHVKAEDLRIIMSKHAALWRDHPKVLARHWYLIGRLDSLHQPAPQGRSELWRSLRIEPASLKTWAALGGSLVGQAWNNRVSNWLRRFKRLAAA